MEREGAPRRGEPPPWAALLLSSAVWGYPFPRQPDIATGVSPRNAPPRAARAFPARLSALLFAFAPPAFADWGLNLPRGITEISRDVYFMHMVVLFISVLIGAAVFVVMTYSIVKHRKSVGAKPAPFSDSTTVDIS